MDDPHLGQAEHRRALVGLARLNWWSRGDAGLWRQIKTEARNFQTQLAAASAQETSPAVTRRLRVLDIATGSGDLPIRLAQRAQAAGLPIQFSGCDISPTAIELATQAAAESKVPVDFFLLDAVHDSLPLDFDIITVSLFLHHLTDQQIVQLLTKVARATRRLIVVNDLVRSRWNYLTVSLATRLLSRSPIVHFDGPTSVLAALTHTELMELANTAGLSGAVLQSQFPARCLLTWRKTP